MCEMAENLGSILVGGKRVVLKFQIDSEWAM